MIDPTRPAALLVVAVALALSACGGDEAEEATTADAPIEEQLSQDEQDLQAITASTARVSLLLSCAGGQSTQAMSWANRIIRAAEKGPDGEVGGETTIEILEEVILEAKEICPAEVTAKLEAAAP